MASDNERIAVLEAAIVSVKEHIEKDAEWKEKMDAKLDVFDNKLSKYSGFFGGIIFAITAVWSVLTFAFKVHNG